MPIKTSGLAEDQIGFGNGITESMIATLSGYKAITVLSSSTSFHAEKISMIDESIRDEFGVDYLIRGSMQVMGKNARLNLEITDLDASKVTVSKKRDFELDDIFGLAFRFILVLWESTSEKIQGWGVVDFRPYKTKF